MNEPISPDEASSLIKDYASGEVGRQNKAFFGKKPKIRPVEFSRPPVVQKKSGVFEPQGWFGRGTVKGAEEEKY